MVWCLELPRTNRLLFATINHHAIITAVKVGQKKVKIDEKFRVRSERLLLPADPSASFYPHIAATPTLCALLPAHSRCDVKYEKEDEQRRHYSLKAGVLLDSFVEGKIDALANAFYAKQKKTIYLLIKQLPK